MACFECTHIDDGYFCSQVSQLTPVFTIIFILSSLIVFFPVLLCTSLVRPCGSEGCFRRRSNSVIDKRFIVIFLFVVTNPSHNCEIDPKQQGYYWSHEIRSLIESSVRYPAFLHVLCGTRIRSCRYEMRKSNIHVHWHHETPIHLAAHDLWSRRLPGTLSTLQY